MSNNNESDFDDVVQEVNLKHKTKKLVESDDDEALVVRPKAPESK